MYVGALVHAWLRSHAYPCANLGGTKLYLGMHFLQKWQIGSRQRLELATLRSRAKQNNDFCHRALETQLGNLDTGAVNRCVLMLLTHDSTLTRLNSEKIKSQISGADPEN